MKLVIHSNFVSCIDLPTTLNRQYSDFGHPSILMSYANEISPTT